MGESTTVQAAPQTTNDLIHSILSSHAKDETTAAPAQPATPKPQANPSAAINSILSNIKPQAGATKSTPQPSADDKIRNILANARNKK